MDTLTNILKTQIIGEVIFPDDQDYDKAREIYNAMIDKYPAIIIKCKNAKDITTAINYGIENKLDVSIRSGGHNGAGLALVDDGLVIDLSLMKDIPIDGKNSQSDAMVQEFL
jgi:FAD/FMN-containing dehydrogenase